jgi:starch-binding outer membrane protein, SusD/RagB family
MTQHRFSARHFIVATAFGLLALPVAGCDVKSTLLDAPIPTVIDPSAVNSAAGADALRIGALGRLRGIAGGSSSGDAPWMFAGLLTDEWKSSDTFSQRNETDQRAVQDNNANLTPVLRELYRTRNSAIEAIGALVTYGPTALPTPLPDADIGQMYMVMGFAEIQLGEFFCNGTPIGESSTGAPISGPPLTNAEVFTLAIAHFDSALTHLTATDAFTVGVKNGVLVAKGRAQVDLGLFSAAATTVSGVPTAFQQLSTFSLTSGSNQNWSLGPSAKRWTVGDSADTGGNRIFNAIPFASAGDPRVPVSGSTQGTSSLGRGFDVSTNLVTTTLWGRTDPAIVVSGIDARLIEAEAKLQANDIPGMMSILNALRATSQDLNAATGTSSSTSAGSVKSGVMAPLATPATTQGAVDLLFREKAFWTFGRGQRLGSLRRLIRQYGGTSTPGAAPTSAVENGSTTFPTGTFFKGGAYGNDVNFPVTVDELNNDKFKACLDRNA